MDRRPFLIAVLLLPAFQGCKLMLYPAARAFGSPSEGELKLRRVAFDHLKARRSTARVIVHPALDPLGARTGLHQGSAEPMVELLKRNGWENVLASAAAPACQPTPLGNNQLRYVQTRARAYQAWVKVAPAEADYRIVVEILSGPPDGIAGIHCYVLEASGQVAYARLQNRHHFGAVPPSTTEWACRMAIRVLLQDLQRKTEEVHPPWGIG